MVERPIEGPSKLTSRDNWYSDELINIDDFKKVTSETPFKKGEGMPGTAWKTQKPLWIPDVSVDKTFIRGRNIKNINLRGAAAFPLNLNRKTVAVFVFFDIKPRKKDKNIMRFFLFLSSQINLIFEQKYFQEELEQSNQELDEYTYTISHDLKEPIRGIKNFASILLEDYQDKLDEDGLEVVNTIVRLADRMNILILSLLEYSRIGKAKYSMKVSDISTLLQEKIDLLSSLLQEQHAMVSIKEPLPSIYCDPIRVGEVFYNLITNAVKYNDKKN